MGAYPLPLLLFFAPVASDTGNTGAYPLPLLLFFAPVAFDTGNTGAYHTHSDCALWALQSRSSWYAPALPAAGRIGWNYFQDIVPDAIRHIAQEMHFIAVQTIYPAGATLQCPQDTIGASAG